MMYPLHTLYDRSRAHLRGREFGPSVLLVTTALALSLFLLLPLGTLLIRSVLDDEGHPSLLRFHAFATAPGMGEAIWNTLWVALTVTCIVLVTAFLYAYALQRSCIPWKGVWRSLGLSPLLGPSLVGAISFIQWFGTQGVLHSWLGGMNVYGAPGIILGTAFASFPHALMILVVALGTIDARLYEAAEALQASPWRKFCTVTLPAAKYGLISAAMVVFAYSVSEFGIPKVIGGNFKVLAVEVYVQAVGQHNFGRGAVVALILLLPVLLAFTIDRHMQHKQRATLTSRAVPYVPRPHWKRDLPLLASTMLTAGALVAVLGMALYTSVITFWPYNLTLTLHHYTYGLQEAGVLSAYLNSLRMAMCTALVGTPFIFGAAYLLEKTGNPQSLLHHGIQALASVPMGVPGLVLGIAYILFFDHPANPINGLYQTLTILVVANVVHHYTSCHLTAMTALKNLDKEFEAVGASLKVSRLVTFWRVTLPVCLPAVLEMFRYLFINAMTTVSAVVFLYSPDTLPASVSILNLDEAGELGPAAAMATLIVATTALYSLLHGALSHVFLRKHQVWRALER